MSGVDDLYVLDDGRPVLAVHVQPGAGRSAVVGRHGRALRMRVAAPPVDDRANTAAGALLATELGVGERDIELVAGPRSRLKRFRISNLEPDEFVARLRRILRDAEAPRGPRSRARAD